MAQGVQGSRRSVCVWANVDRSAARRGRERPRSRRRPPVNRIPDGSAPLSGAPFPSYRGPRARRMRVPSVVRNLLYGENLNLFSKQRRFRHPPVCGEPCRQRNAGKFRLCRGSTGGERSPPVPYLRRRKAHKRQRRLYPSPFPSEGCRCPLRSDRKRVPGLHGLNRQYGSSLVGCLDLKIAIPRQSKL